MFVWLFDSLTKPRGSYARNSTASSDRSIFMSCCSSHHRDEEILLFPSQISVWKTRCSGGFNSTEFHNETSAAQPSNLVDGLFPDWDSSSLCSAISLTQQFIDHNSKATAHELCLAALTDALHRWEMFSMGTCPNFVKNPIAALGKWFSVLVRWKSMRGCTTSDRYQHSMCWTCTRSNRWNPWTRSHRLWPWTRSNGLCPCEWISDSGSSTASDYWMFILSNPQLWTTSSSVPAWIK